ncbi:MAG TPA: hypothetical protein VFE35_04535 [Candidatus Cybelea sp.]|jgi:hypothetical protein|nr:hypothetical protein [Candidatus Cybelea sp.]
MADAHVSLRSTIWSTSVLHADRAVVALLTTLTLAADPSDTAGRRQVTGHYNVPRAHAAAPRAPSASNLVTNPGFETGKIDGGWYDCGDESARVTISHPYSGGYDEFSGTRSGSGEPVGNSGVCQAITIPPAGVLTAQLYQLSNESDTSFAYQEADLLDDSGSVVVNLYKTVNYKPAWVRGTWNLGAYAGRTFWLYFGVHGDGYQQRTTQQFVDDVVLTGGGTTSRE